MSNASSDFNSGNETDNISNNRNAMMGALSCVLSFIWQLFTRAPPINLPNPEEDVVDLEGGQDTVGHVSSGISNRGINDTTRNKTGAGNSITGGSAVNTSSLLSLQNIGLKIVKFWVLPTSMVMAVNALSTTVTLFHVFKTNQSVAASTETFMLTLYFGSTTGNVVLGATLFLLSTTKGNFRRKVFFLKGTILLTFVSGTTEIVLLIAVAWQFASSG